MLSKVLDVENIMIGKWVFLIKKLTIIKKIECQQAMG